MYSITPARLRGRTRRALLAAALSAAMAAFALPAASEAAMVAINPFAPGALGYTAAPGETNQVFIRVDGNQLRISDNTAPITAGNGCALDAFGTARCPISVDFVGIQLGDGNDRLEYAAPHEGFVSGQGGNDLFLGGLRQAAPGRPIEPLFYDGQTGLDTVSYQFADRGVRVDTADNPSNTPSLAQDGRPGDLEDVDGDDIEIIEGSNFADTLLGSHGSDLFLGRNGDDRIEGRGGDDVFDEGSGPSGPTASSATPAPTTGSSTARVPAGSRSR
jgi:Ca2+-binding RTX toxin-like protein